MKHFATRHKVFHLKTKFDRALYDGKTVEFIFDQETALLILTGRFVLQRGPNYESMSIHYCGRLDPMDPPQARYVFQLSQAHLESAVPANKPGAKVDFLLERPVWRRQFSNKRVTLSRDLRASTNNGLPLLVN